jgi:hypothetical protein
MAEPLKSNVSKILDDINKKEELEKFSKTKTIEQGLTDISKIKLVRDTMENEAARLKKEDPQQYYRNIARNYGFFEGHLESSKKNKKKRRCKKK